MALDMALDVDLLPRACCSGLALSTPRPLGVYSHQLLMGLTDIITRLFRRLRFLLQRRRLERELDEEMETHRTMRRAQFEANGMSPSDAAASTRRSFGNDTLAREDIREMWIGRWIDTTRQDVRYACRSLTSRPGFALSAIGMLGATISLNTALVTMASGLLWQPWAVPDPGSVVQIYRTSAAAPSVTAGKRDGDGTMTFRLDDYRSLADQARSISIFATGCVHDVRVELCQMQLDGERVLPAFVTANYFTALRIPMLRGRTFRADEDDRNRPAAVAIISHSLWERRFGSDANIVGREVRIDAVPVTVIGVTSRGFNGPSLFANDVWIPIAAGGLWRPDRHVVWVGLAGRLGAGVSREQAEAELQSLYQPTDGRRSRLHLIRTSSFARSNDRRELVAGFAVLFAGVALVWILACANVGNLLLARMLTRSREVAVRLSLGARRLRIVRQLLTEGLVLSAAASLIGIGIASALATFVFRQALGNSYRLAYDLKPDGWVMLYGCGLAVLTCIAFALGPALFASRSDLVPGRKDAHTRSMSRMRSSLLCVQIAGSVVLLSAAGLLVRGVQHARSGDPGFLVAGLTAITFELPLSYSPSQTEQAARSFVDLGDRFSGGTQITVALAGPSHQRLRTTVDDPVSGDRHIVSVMEVAANYFGVIGSSLTGRTLTSSDGGRQVVVINESLARRLWPNASPLGHKLTVRTQAGLTEHEVVGVAKNADPAGETQPGHTMAPMIYGLLGYGATLHGHARGTAALGLPDILVRGTSAAVVQELQARVDGVNPLISVEATLVSDRLDRRYSEPRFLAAIAGVLGGLALALSIVGVFGVFAFIVRQRVREIGIRIALGARSSQLVRDVLGFGARPLLLGVGLGLTGAFAGAQLLRSSLLGLSPLDPWTYISVLAVLLVTAVFALGLPAWRATQTDPTIALKSE